MISLSSWGGGPSTGWMILISLKLTTEQLFSFTKAKTSLKIALRMFLDGLTSTYPIGIDWEFPRETLNMYVDCI